MPTHFAGEGAGHGPYLSRTELLPRPGVIGCFVSQHQHAPKEPMNLLPFEQTNVMGRGAAQTSTGNKAARNLPWSREALPFSREHQLQHWSGAQGVQVVGQEWALREAMGAGGCRDGSQLGPW